MPVHELAQSTSSAVVDDDDYALMDRVATGDCRALESLYYRFHPRLARFLWRLIGRREGLEEMINDTFVDVWKSASNFREASLVISAWIFGFAYRRAIEYLCRRRSSSAWPNMGDPLEQAKDDLDNVEIGDALVRGLGIVPFQQRLALLLAYQMDYGLEEVVAITGVSAATVKAQLLCAREKLRCLLPDEAPSARSPSRTPEDRW
jgi:RNA polymerase sigma-70 factor, ECF subfamily